MIKLIIRYTPWALVCAAIMTGINIGDSAGATRFWMLVTCGVLGSLGVGLSHRIGAVSEQLKYRECVVIHNGAEVSRFMGDADCAAFLIGLSELSKNHNVTLLNSPEEDMANDTLN